MKFDCKYCGKAIAAEGINLERALAKCAACNAVSDISEALDGIQRRRKLRSGADDPDGVDRETIGLPANVRDESTEYRLRLVRRWFSKSVLILAFFCVFWDGFLIFWYFIAFTEDTPLIMKIFPVLHVAIGIVLTYGVACGFINHTIVEAEGGELRVRHGPLPVPGNRRLTTADIKQLYTRERVRRGKNGYNYNYEVRAKLHQGKSIMLLSYVDDPELALAYEKRIEQFLKIEDEPVRGELRR